MFVVLGSFGPNQIESSKRIVYIRRKQPSRFFVCKFTPTNNNKKGCFNGIFDRVPAIKFKQQAGKLTPAAFFP